MDQVCSDSQEELLLHAILIWLSWYKVLTFATCKLEHKVAANTVWHDCGLLFTSLNPTSTHQAEWITIGMAGGLLIP